MTYKHIKYKHIKYKHYEIVENLDNNIARYTYEKFEECETVKRENMFELDIVYFGFIRLGLKLEDKKYDINNLIQGQQKLAIYRSTLEDFLKIVSTWKFIFTFDFQTMFMRRTFIKFKDIKDLKDKLPEYFV